MRTLKLLIMPIFMVIVAIIATSCANNIVFTIYFDSNGGSDVMSITSDGASMVSIPEDPNKEGFIFDGWFWDNGTFEMPFTANSIMDTPISSNMTVYAKWSLIGYEINYVLNGGINPPSNPTTYDSETVTLNISDPTQIGHQFEGWYLDEDLTQIFTFESSMETDITLYAKWSINSYTLQYLDNDGTVLYTSIYEYGASLSGVVPPVASKEGFDFVEWNQDLPLTMPAMDLMITARYVTKECIMSFNSNGGSEISDLIVSYESIIYAPENPSKDNYVFGGWYLDEALTDSFSFPTTMTEDIQLYAKWESLSYTIDYYIVGVDQMGTIEMSEGETMVNITLGVRNSSAITSEGRFFIWGENSYYQLADGTNQYQTSPVDITNLFDLEEGERIVDDAWGSQAVAALTSHGRLFTWGYNGNGLLGDEAVGERTYPAEITSKFDLDEGDKIISVSMGEYHGSALTSTGRIFMWGRNPYGQLGDGTDENRFNPIEITSQFSLLEGEQITGVSLGRSHSSAITSNGNVFIWGYNYHGELGIGTEDNSNIPIKMTNQFNLGVGEQIIQVSLGSAHSSAITSNGRIFMWGYNDHGELGDGTEIDKMIPLDITNQFDLDESDKIVNVSVGQYHSLVVTSNGRVFTWGYNYYGQLGFGEADYLAHSEPIEITNNFDLSQGEKIIWGTLGSLFSSAFTSSGRIYTWGWNNGGQLGVSSIANKYLPVEVTAIDEINIHSEDCGYGLTITGYVPIKEGFTFSGWYIDAGLTTPYAFTTMPDHALKLYGIWMLN
ncbi:MAG: InlB B-repeat-containing protein [Acholeplasmataceae bacterium]|nr:InlB B-repeat-containing protein [Acholeplasmataceae bacterium]